MSNITVYNNQSYNFGGGISLEDNSIAILKNITISENSSENDGNSSNTNYGGGGIYIKNSNASLYNVNDKF